MADFHFRIYLILLLLFIAGTNLFCQIQITNVDNKGKVLAVLPTPEGPIYYLQKNDGVIYKNDNNSFKLKVYDGYKDIDLHLLGKNTSIDAEVTLDRLSDGTIFIRFSQFGLFYVYNPLDNSLETFSTIIGNRKIHTISIIKGILYYGVANIDKSKDCHFVKYENGEHEIVFDAEYFIMNIYNNGNTYLVLINRVDNGDYLFYEWHHMDLQGNFLSKIEGIEKLGSSLKFEKVKVINHIKHGENLYFNKLDDKFGNYKWDRQTNSITRFEISEKERKIERAADKADNFVEVFSDNSMDTNFKLYTNNRKVYNFKAHYNMNNIRDVQIGSSIYELWIGSNDGLLRINLTSPAYTSILPNLSMRSVEAIDDEKLLACTSDGKVYTIDRGSDDDVNVLKIYDFAQDNRFIKRNSKDELLFDGSWKVFRLNSDMSVTNIFNQNSNWYSQLLEDDRLFVSNSIKSNYIIDIENDSRDTNFLAREIGKVVDCINLEYNKLATASDKGISVFEANGDKFIFQDSAKLFAMSLLQFNNNELWVGYEDGSLRKYVHHNDIFRLENEWLINEGFGIAKIIKTKENRLWITTFNGVCIFDLTSSEFFFLDRNKLTNPECNRYSCFYDSIYEKVYVGTINGLNIIDANVDLEISDSFKFFYVEKSFPMQNKDSTITTNILYKETVDIILPSYRRGFSLSFSTPHSTSDSDIKYQYRLNGEDWADNGNANFLRYNYLPSGKNIIEIRAQKDNNQLSNNTLIANIYATPFFYERWWVRLSVGLLLAAGSLFWYWRLKSENKRLEIAVEERTDELKRDKATIEKQAHELGELDKLKNQFFANVSHELRTPLTLLISPIEGISTGENLTEEQRNLLLIMKDNGHLLQNRISELLELSRLTSKKVELKKQKLNIGNLIDLSTKIFEPLAAKKDIRFEVKKENVDHSIIGDENRLSKIIQNLIINAIKFSNEKGLVSCSFSIANNILKIEVKDNGIGIKKEFLDKIFQRFYQIKSNNANANPGTGIGLAMVAEYIKLMNGQISVESEFGKGTTFSIEVPIEVAQQVNEAPVDFEVTPLPISFEPISSKLKPKLLIAEDNESLRNYIKLILKEYFEIIEAENGKIALELLHNDSEVDIILSDIMMPVMDGITLLDKVRNDDNLRLKPFVFLTAKHNEEDIANAFRLGVDDYLKKPFSEKELIYRLNAVYANYKARVEFIKEEASIQNKDSILEEPTSDFISRLHNIILTNIQSNEFSLEFLAEKLGTSKSSLIRTVKKEIGLTPNKFILEIRLNKARQLYESGQSLNLNEVASQIGFSTAWYFQKLYVERFGVEWST